MGLVLRVGVGSHSLRGLPAKMAGLYDGDATHDLDDGPAEIGEIVGLAAGDEVAVDDDRSILPDGAGIDEVVFDAGRARDADAAVNAGRDRNPAAVADRGDEFFGFGELAHETFYFFVAAKFIGHEAAGDHDAVEVVALHEGDRSIRATRVAVLAAIDGFALRASDGDVGTGLGET